MRARRAVRVQTIAGLGLVADATIRLRPLPAASLRLQQMSIGVNTDGSTFGWDFAAGTTTTDAARADLFPETFSGKTLQVRAGRAAAVRPRADCWYSLRAPRARPAA